MDPTTPATQTPAPPTDPQQRPAAATEGVRDQDKMMLFLAYFGIFGLIPFSVVKDSDYVHWHAKQGLTYSVLAIGVWVAWAVLSFILHAIHLGLLAGLGGFALAVALTAIWFLALVKAMSGERWRIPFVADLADRW